MYEIKYRQESQLKYLENTWIKSLPKDWRYMKLSYLGEIITGNTPSKNIEKYYENGSIPWIKPDNIKDDFNITDTKEKLSKSGLKVARLVPKNSAIVCCIGTVGKVGFNKIESTTNQQINSVVFDKPQKWISKYGMYSIIASRGEHERNSYKVVVAILNKTQQGKIKMCCPSVNEQEKIANFLDIKTAQFDNIIAKKEQLIKKLEEAKKSLISEMVTGKVKIIDGQLIPRDASEMKDGGVEWLRMIPNKWEVTKVKHLLKNDIGRIKIGPFGSALKLQDMVMSSEFKVYGQENLIKESFDIGQRFISSSKFKNMKQYELLEGDIAISMMGTIGKSKVVPFGIQRGIMDSHLLRLRINKDISNVRYLNNLIRESHLIKEQLRYMSNGSIMSGLNSSIVKNLIVCNPSIDEQDELVEYLQLEDQRLINLIDKTVNQIEKLKQAKQSLIFEAVTGKIDLRDWEIIDEGELL